MVLRLSFLLAFSLLFSCSDFERDGITDPGNIDGRSYSVTTMGNLIWMTQNLNRDAGDSKCYNNSTSNCSKYGRMYNWNTANSICPGSWRLPSKDERSSLSKNFLSGQMGGWYIDGKFGGIGTSNDVSYWWGENKRMFGVMVKNDNIYEGGGQTNDYHYVRCVRDKIE